MYKSERELKRASESKLQGFVAFPPMRPRAKTPHGWGTRGSMLVEDFQPRSQHRDRGHPAGCS